MSQKNCPKCKKPSDNADECDNCGTVFADYEKNKQQGLGQVYGLISEGKLEDARELAQRLAKEFPDSMGNFLLLLSNINRDISIVKRYDQAQECFDQRDYNQVALLLRNIKAFDRFLDEKVISLRKKAEHCIAHDQIFNDAVAQYNEGEFATAMALFKELDGYADKEAVEGYLQKLEGKKDDLLHKAKDCLEKNLFDLALVRFDELHTVYPETRQETEEYLFIITRKKEITDALLAVADKAREERRFLEANVIYSYLVWQNPELEPHLTPYIDNIIEETGSRAIINLADCERKKMVDFAALGIKVDSNGFLEPLATDQQEEDATKNGQEAHAITSVAINPVPFADTESEPVDLEEEEVADFV